MKKRLSYCVHLVYVSVHFKFIFIPSTSKQIKSGGFCCNNYVHLFDDMYVCFYVLQLSLFLSLNFLVLSVATEIETYVLQKCLVHWKFKNVDLKAFRGYSTVMVP